MKFRIITTLLIFCLISCTHKSEKKIEKNEITSDSTKNINSEIITEKISKENLPKEITYEGKLKEISKWNDLDGTHIVILTESGKIKSEKLEDDSDDGYDYKIFAYHFLLDKTNNEYKLNWKIYDYISYCTFDLLMGFIKNTFVITDLNKNGKAEIWTMYQKTCTSDVSPSEMKIIMYEGKQKFALRGNSIVNPGTEKIGGDYKLDESLSKAPKKIKEFALKMWKENNEQKYE